MKRLIQTLLGLFVLIWIFHALKMDVTTLYNRLSHPRYLLVDLAVPCLVYFISANRWNLFLRQVGIRENLITLIKLNLMSVFQGLVIPSSQGFDVVRIYYIEKRHPEFRGKAGGTVIIERILGFAILCLLSLFFSLFNKTLPNKDQIVTVISIISISLFACLLVMFNKKLCLYLPSLYEKHKRLNRFLSYISKVHIALVSFQYKKILLSSVVLILLFQFLTILSVCFVFNAYGCFISIFTHIIIYPIISILSMVPITFSGIGMREGFFVFFYSQLGVPADICVIVSLVNYLIIVLLPAIIGFILYMADILKKERTIL